MDLCIWYSTDTHTALHFPCPETAHKHIKCCFFPQISNFCSIFCFLFLINLLNLFLIKFNFLRPHKKVSDIQQAGTHNLCRLLRLGSMTAKHTSMHKSILSISLTMSVLWNCKCSRWQSNPHHHKLTMFTGYNQGITGCGSQQRHVVLLNENSYK